MKTWLKSNPLYAVWLLLGVSLAVYIVGFTWLFVPVLLFVLARYLPFPRLFESYVSRLVVSFLALISGLLIAILLQFYIFHNTGFRMLALLITVIVAAVVWYFRNKAPQPVGVKANRKDAAALLVVLLFALPVIAVTGIASRSVDGIARFGGIQSPDGANHFMILSQVSEKQHLDFDGTSYYPMGFHLSLAFMQDSVGLNQSGQRFGINARLFIMQYLLFGSVLAFTFAYFCRFVLDLLGAKLKGYGDFTVAFAAGLPVVVLFLLPFMYQGFINYYYVVTVALAGLIYLAAAFSKEGKEPAQQRLHILGYLLLVFGAGMSWPLLVPLFLLIPALYFLPPITGLRQIPGLIRAGLQRQHWPVIAALALQLVPIYMQMRYAVIGTGDQFNAYGSIRTFSYGLVAGGLALVMYASISKTLPAEIARFIRNVFQPFFVFLLGLMVIQYFTAGELRYYAIKTSLLLEIILIAIAAVGVVVVYAQRTTGWVERFCMPVLIVMAGLLLLIGMNANPLKDTREMFRKYSGFGTPAFYGPDTTALTNVAAGDHVNDSNLAVVHYDSATDKLFSNMMPVNWITVMQARPVTVTAAQICSADLYSVAIYQEPGPQQQFNFTSKMRECITIARKANRPFFIVTDNGSYEYVQSLFGGYATVVKEQ
ncbi:MAG TPA: hypothetical protein VLF62_04065 [Candidatus Saccharimonadales bacterium]|nr:hypothetical protein [Candidatus Saccharimonadales bacterium]